VRRADRLVSALLGLLLGGGACAAHQPPPTIEPGNTIEPSPPPADDRAFVLSRDRATARPTVAYQVNIGEKWWGPRAEFLRISEARVRLRDEEISEVSPPEGFWDTQTSVEAVAVWSALCNECHGGRRRVEDAVSMPPPPGEWGRGDGLFFGARRRYTDVFLTIYRGGPDRKGVRSAMPPWRGKLARELIWALLYFLEYQSGGIEGRFPPSLYPRGDVPDRVPQ
jgi:hypothetical protein